MIADALRCEVEAYAAGMPRTNPLYYRAADGTLTPRHLTRYLASVHYLIAHTPMHLALAREGALARGDSQLADHFAHKLDEEQGHDAWAVRDFERMRAAAAAAARLEPCDAMRDLVDYVSGVIAREPRHYLSYILFAEYLIVLLGPKWLELLEERCSIPRTSMTVIDNHAELDREHTDEALDLIDTLVPDPRDLAPMRCVMQSTIERFERFCFEVLAEVDRDEELSRRSNVVAA
jgi:hypothetical protein